MLWLTTYIGLEFSTQKNCVKGKIIRVSKSSTNIWCPILAGIHRVIALWWASASLDTPLHACREAGKWWGTKAAHITYQLHTIIGAQYGLAPVNISAYSLCTSRAMAMMCTDIYSGAFGSLVIGAQMRCSMKQWLHHVPEGLIHLDLWFPLSTSGKD